MSDEEQAYYILTFILFFMPFSISDLIVEWITSLFQGHSNLADVILFMRNQISRIRTYHHHETQKMIDKGQ